MLDELIIAGEMQESSKKSVLRAVSLGLQWCEAAWGTSQGADGAVSLLANTGGSSGFAGGARAR